MGHEIRIPELEIVFQKCKNPHKYTGRPNILKYSRSSQKEMMFTNQDCVIKNGKYVKFPKTKLQLNIGKLGVIKGKLKQVRIIPKYSEYVVELVIDVPSQQPLVEENGRYMVINLGIDNLATIVTNIGINPVLVMSKASINVTTKRKLIISVFSVKGNRPTKVRLPRND
jgi:putative transposase